MMVISGLVGQASVCCGKVLMVLVGGGGGADVNMEDLGKGEKKKKKYIFKRVAPSWFGVRLAVPRCSQAFLGY